jgi:hypothetical protein
MSTLTKKILGIMIALSLSFIVFADEPPDPGGEPTNGTPVGGSPLGGGLVISLVLGAAYASKKIYSLKKKI